MRKSIHRSRSNSYDDSIVTLHRHSNNQNNAGTAEAEVLIPPQQDNNEEQQQQEPQDQSSNHRRGRGGRRTSTITKRTRSSEDIRDIIRVLPVGNSNNSKRDHISTRTPTPTATARRSDNYSTPLSNGNRSYYTDTAILSPTRAILTLIPSAAPPTPTGGVSDGSTAATYKTKQSSSISVASSLSTQTLRKLIVLVAIGIGLFQFQFYIYQYYNHFQQNPRTTTYDNKNSNNGIISLQQQQQKDQNKEHNRHFDTVNIKKLRISNFIRKQHYPTFNRTNILLSPPNIACPLLPDINGDFLIPSSSSSVDMVTAANNGKSKGKHVHNKQQQQVVQTSQVPTFIIAGVQKAGTTALYYMIQHVIQRVTNSKIISSTKFETHFFYKYSKMYNNQELYTTNLYTNMTNATTLCTLRSLYQNEFTIPPKFMNHTLPNQRNVITYEKSPIYITRPQIPTLIYNVAPKSKIILLLRNPIHRLLSHYKMDQARIFYTINKKLILQLQQSGSSDSSITTKPGKAPKFSTKGLQSFVQVVDYEIGLLRKYNLTNAPKLSWYLNATVKQRKKYRIFRLHKSLEERTCCNMEHTKIVDPFVQQKRRMMVLPVSRGIYSQQIYYWLHPMYGGIGPYRLNQNIHIINYDVYIKNPSQTLHNIMKFLPIHYRQYRNGTYVKLPEHSPLYDIDYNPTKMKGSPTNPNLLVRNFTSTDSIPTKPMNDASELNYTRTTTTTTYTVLDNIHDFVKTSNDILKIRYDDVVYEYLYKFYKPYNDELVSLIGGSSNTKEWKNVWKY